MASEYPLKIKNCRYCGKKCKIPAWFYCSDDCRRLLRNKKQNEKENNK